MKYVIQTETGPREDRYRLSWEFMWRISLPVGTWQWDSALVCSPELYVGRCSEFLLNEHMHQFLTCKWLDMFLYCRVLNKQQTLITTHCHLSYWLLFHYDKYMDHLSLNASCFLCQHGDRWIFCNPSSIIKNILYGRSSMYEQFHQHQPLHLPYSSKHLLRM